MIWRKLASALTALCLAVPASACLWDSDTLAMETKTFPGLLDVLIGNFDRYPDLYYSMRLERVAGEVSAEPDSLALYDDAGVAADRLHRGAEAIAWMAKKKAALDRAADSEEKKTHLYRYHANLGTFIIHDWLRSGADAENIASAKEARTHIAKAIEINPDAHFGRERYQLMAMDWLIAVRSGEHPAALEDEPQSDPASILPVTTTRRRLKPGALEEIGFGDAIEGFSGLVVLGDGWQSADIFYALQRSLEVDGHHSAALVAHLRVRELESADKKGFAPAHRGAHYGLQHPESVNTWYIAARDESKEHFAARNAAILKKLEAGKHPDTHPKFWFGIPALAEASPHFQTNARVFEYAKYVALIAGVVTVAYIILGWVRQLRQKR